MTIGQALFLTSLLAAMISFHNTTARYAFALGRERVLPAVFGQTSPRTGAPRVASLAQSVLGLVVIVLYAVAGWDPLVQLFFWGGTAGGFGVLLLIATTSVAVIAFFARTGGAGDALAAADRARPRGGRARRDHRGSRWTNFADPARRRPGLDRCAGRSRRSTRSRRCWAALGAGAAQQPPDMYARIGLGADERGRRARSPAATDAGGGR